MCNLKHKKLSYFEVLDFLLYHRLSYKKNFYKKCFSIFLWNSNWSISLSVTSTSLRLVLIPEGIFWAARFLKQWLFSWKKLFTKDLVIELLRTNCECNSNNWCKICSWLWRKICIAGLRTFLSLLGSCGPLSVFVVVVFFLGFNSIFVSFFTRLVICLAHWCI